jgi:hypothetical protein
MSAASEDRSHLRLKFCHGLVHEEENFLKTDGADEASIE